MNRYHHLSIEERESILQMQAMGFSLRRIAARLSRSASTISRELRRNKPEYSPSSAQKAYLRRKPHRQPLLSDPQLKAQVESLLSLFWSPEQIANRLRLEGASTVSCTTIYRALDAGLLDVELRTKLRIKYRPYRKGHKGRTGQIPVDLWIDDRPEAANRREQFGHWESDTMLGTANGAALATHVERKSRFTVARLIPKKQAIHYTEATIEAFSHFPGHMVKSFTVDHGKEFARYRHIRDALNADVYFAHVGNPGERGTNENTNGLLRQWFPRRTDMSSLTKDDVDSALLLLNHRPRKCLNWRTPSEVLFATVLHFT